MRHAVFVLAVVGVMVLASSAGLVSVRSGLAATPFTVDSRADDADANPGNGTCATSRGECTLRAAIEEANLHRGPDAIFFDIPGSGVQTITLNRALPTISDESGRTTIHGYTQPGSSPNTSSSSSNAKIMVQISAPAERSTNGIVITSAGNAVRGLAFFDLGNAITIKGFKGSNASGNTIAGNFIGTDAAGDFAASITGLPGDGVTLRAGANHNSIGGFPNSTGDDCIEGSAADRNVISGNSYRGVAFFGENTKHNCVVNNIVGLGPAGDKALPNRTHGIDLNRGSSLNQVGGTEQGMRNVVSGNLTNGVEISHWSTTVANEVVGNFIGTDLTGNTGPAYAINGQVGVHVEDDATGNEIVGNVIGNNASAGIRLRRDATGTIVRGNRIGVSLNGSPIPNESSGVLIIDGPTGSRVGPDNVIANNLGGGIRVRIAETDRNTITANSIYDNNSLGIDLDPVQSANPNDAGDRDSGANEQLNFPLIERATPQQVTGSACAGCEVEVFRADGGAGAYGEGKTFLGSATADGGGSFTVAVSGVGEGDYVSATATDAAGNTSEFSLNRLVGR